MHTALQIRSANARARSLTRSSANELQRDGQRAADLFAAAIGFAEQAGASKDALVQLRAVLFDDVFGSIQGGIDRMLDDQGIDESQNQIELGELKP